MLFLGQSRIACFPLQRDRQVNATAVSHRDHYIVLVEPLLVAELVEPLVAQLVVLAPLAEPAVNVIPPDASSPGEATGILRPILKVESTLWMAVAQPQENISLQSSVTNF